MAQRVPVVGWREEWAEDGALLSYGIDRSGTSSLGPELIVNAKTAKALGITLSRSILERAARVIE